MDILPKLLLFLTALFVLCDPPAVSGGGGDREQ